MVGSMMKKQGGIFCLVVSFLCFLAAPLGAQVDKIDDFKRAIEADPRDYAPHFAQGRSYQSLGLYEQAIQEFQETLRLEPLFAAAYQGFG